MKKSMQKQCSYLLVTIALTIAFSMFSAITLAQTTVTGKVTDSKDGSPVVGVTVAVKGAKGNSQTGADGSYTIKVPAGATTLVFTSVGFAKQELPVAATVNVSFVASNQQLNEVIVVGYGTVKKKDLTGSLTTISSKDFQKGAIATPEQLILGKVAGVSIISNGGAPGAGSTIRIRGGASLSGSNDPLIIIDGVQLAGGNIAGSPNPLSLINPNDIETFTILKDAAAVAIYGSRATSGVIIITTKKGKSGKAKISFSSLISIGSLTKKLDVLSADEFRSFVNANGTAAQRALLGTANTDWQNEVFQTAIGTDNNLSISGSTKGKVKMPYRVSASYFNQDGLLRTNNLQRFTASINVNPRFLNDHLKVDISLKGTNTKSRFANEGAIGGAVTFDPTQPVKTNNSSFGGYWEWLDPNSTSGLKQLAPRNPVSLFEIDNRSSVNRAIGNIQVDYKFHFLPDLRFNANIGFDVAKGSGNVIADSVYATQFRTFSTPSLTNGGTRRYYQEEFRNSMYEYYLAYGKDIKGLKSRIDITAGYGFYKNTRPSYYYASYFYDGTKNPLTEPRDATDNFKSNLESYYGKFSYSYNQKYLLTASLRTDGSSRLNPNDRWLTYYSLAGAWKIKEEGFLKNSKAISELKLRASYGITGNQDGIPLYSYLYNFQLSNVTAQYQFGNDFYYMYRPLAYNDKLTWEQTATTNIGIDYGFFDNRITGSVDVYLKETSNLLNVVNQSAGTNFAAIVLSNVGNMENRGIEFSINTIPVKKKDLTVEFGYNVTYNRNRITKLTFNDDPSYKGQLTGGISGGTGGTVQINSVGFPQNSFFVYKQVYDVNGKPIDNLFEDLNRDGVINENDKYRYKSANADVFMGFTGNITYKHWNAGFIMRASLGNYIYNNVNSNTGTIRSILNPIGVLANGSRNVLETGFSGNGDLFYRSDYFVQNASFLRMDNINVGYSFGKVFKGKADLRVNANVQNAFLITKYKGADPEIGGGIDNNFYPRPRTFVFGVNLDF